MDSDKRKCKKCKKYFLLGTLKKYDGINCGNCYKLIIKPIKKKSNTKRKKISAINRKILWKKYYENKINGKCQLCNVSDIDVFTFECGHDKPHSKGGTNNIENLLPICGHCNKSMGVKTFDQVKSEIIIPPTKEELEKIKQEELENKIKQEKIKQDERLKTIEQNKINCPNDYRSYLKYKDSWACPLLLKNLFDPNPNISRMRYRSSVPLSRAQQEILYRRQKY